MFSPAEGGGVRVGSRDLPQGRGWRVDGKDPEQLWLCPGQAAARLSIESGFGPVVWTKLLDNRGLDLLYSDLLETDC